MVPPFFTVTMQCCWQTLLAKAGLKEKKCSKISPSLFFALHSEKQARLCEDSPKVAETPEFEGPEFGGVLLFPADPGMPCTSDS